MGTCIPFKWENRQRNKNVCIYKLYNMNIVSILCISFGVDYSMIANIWYLFITRHM